MKIITEIFKYFDNKSDM